MFDGINPWHVLLIAIAIPCTLACLVCAVLIAYQWACEELGRFLDEWERDREGIE